MLLTIVDTLPPEVIAMLQAEYSRNHLSIRSKIDFDEEGVALVSAESIEKLKTAIAKWYTGYGHNSIGDCGTTTLFIEGVSIIAAKAVQDNNLYNGQECSTRYIPFNECSRKYPIETYESSQEAPLRDRAKFLVDASVDLAMEVHAELVVRLKAERPQKEGESETVYTRAMNAKGFDIARSLLPAGVCTNLAWTGTLRNVRDNLRRLANNPLEEVRSLAKALWKTLHARYPYSFAEKLFDGFNGQQVDWMADVTNSTAFLDMEAHATHKNRFEVRKASYLEAIPTNKSCMSIHMGDAVATLENTDYRFSLKPTATFMGKVKADSKQLIPSLLDFLKTRPKGCEVPYSFNILGRVRLISVVDYGGWRDLQRHRSGITITPRLPGNFHFHEWYLGQFRAYLSEATFQKIIKHISEVMELTGKLEQRSCLAVDYQYLVPLGAEVVLYQDYGLASFIYTIETRSSSTVHPIVRKIALDAAEAFMQETNIPLHIGKDHADSIHRGTQTILREKDR